MHKKIQAKPDSQSRGGIFPFLSLFVANLFLPNLRMN
jgi:hypothetical protein